MLLSNLLNGFSPFRVDEKNYPHGTKAIQILFDTHGTQFSSLVDRRSRSIPMLINGVLYMPSDPEDGMSGTH